MLSKAQIAGLIPHAGSMCLLDEVLAWDSTTIRTSSQSHRDPHNPMRVAGHLCALCGIEYAAQSMAIHGGLSAAVAGTPSAGYLASVRDVSCFQRRLDGPDGALTVEAERLMGDASRVIYRFTLWVGETEVLNGRAAVVLDAGPVPA